ncbi:MAG: 16S rRNA (cytosine(1402)-N(4))-methyltransferase RsmH [Dehalococcoidia bacterium]|nr:16S rRNA (cytosine(1402)-N(4))-methyltransferase RsmH [Dehalococcoidia bacterium]
MTLLTVHIPVMLKEAVEGLAVTAGGRYVDCTLGAAGHASIIMAHSQPGGQLLGIDADPAALSVAHDNLAAFGHAVLIANDNFGNLEAICHAHEFTPVNGILFDLGVSSLQIGPSGRGFSFQHDAPLDMRFNPRQERSAADIVNTCPESELARLIYTYGEEERSRQIARAIVGARPLTSTIELASVIERVSPGYHRLHPATRTFQALRIATNEELTRLSSALEQAVSLLGHGGRLVVISYHSLEDRIVKGFLRHESARCVCPPGLPQCVCRHTPRLRLISKSALTPSQAETSTNPRSRSAKMRIAERIISQEAGKRRTASRSNKILRASKN